MIVNFFHIEEEYTNYAQIESSAVNTILKWTQDNYGYSNLIMGVFVAFMAKAFFRKYGYNFFEILILLCFVSGIEMLIASFFGIIEGIAKIHLLQIASLICIIYSSWAIGHFFKNKPINYLKAFLAYILGGIMFFIFIVFLGNAIDLIV